MHVVISPPFQNDPNGLLLSTYCAGTTKMGRYADGNGGTYDQTIQTNSTDCGYDPTLQGGGGGLRVNVAWTAASDLDIKLTAPDGLKYGFGQPGGGNGLWDHDATSSGQENVSFSPSGPAGTYRLDITNYSGVSPGTVTVTVIANGITKKVDMSAYAVNTARALFSKYVSFGIGADGNFTANPTAV